MSYHLLKDLNERAERIIVLPHEEKFEALINSYLTAESATIWQLYASLKLQALHNRKWDDLVELISLKWERLLGKIIHDGISSGVYNTKNNPECVIRQLDALLCGYSYKLMSNPDMACRQRVKEDLNAFMRIALY